MKRPVFLGIMGAPKGGKTYTACTLFESLYLPPESVLYLDNHGSTIAEAESRGLHQWTRQEPWGIKHLSPEKPSEMTKALEEFHRVQQRATPPYQALVIDDFSEYATKEIDDRLDECSEGMVIQEWGRHLKVLKAGQYNIHPAINHAHVIVIFWAEQLPDPREEKTKVVRDSKLVFSSDTRDTMLRPYLQGAFAKQLPYKLDALFYQHREEKRGGYEFQLQMAPDKEVDVLTRWLQPWIETPRLDKNMVDPTFDKIIEFIKNQAREETNASN